jgi:hypothetical protein
MPDRCVADIYVAASWRTASQPLVVKYLRENGYTVYDFRDPEDNRGTGFQWSDIDPEWQAWTPEVYRAKLDHPLAVAGFQRDMHALDQARAVVLVNPSGRSAHLEAAWAIGRGKPVVAFLWPGDEPDLIYRLFDALVIDGPELLAALKMLLSIWISVIDDQTCEPCQQRDGMLIASVGTPPHEDCESPDGCRCYLLAGGP